MSNILGTLEELINAINREQEVTEITANYSSYNATRARKLRALERSANRLWKQAWDIRTADKKKEEGQ